MIAPGNLSGAAPLIPLFQWTDASQEDSYVVEIDDEATFAAPLAYQTAALAAGTTTLALPPGVLDVATLYHWRVRAINTLGDTLAANSPFSFTTGTIPVWARSYGGTAADAAADVQPTPDGGFIACGSTLSFGAGGVDAWIVRVDALGAVVWEKAYGGAQDDLFRSVRPTPDGGCVVVGETKSFGAGQGDVWVLKLDVAGSPQWQKAFCTAASDERGRVVRSTADGGYVVGADIPTVPTFFYQDSWVLKLAANGTLTWQHGYGGAGTEQLNDLQQTRDGGYIFAGGFAACTSCAADPALTRLAADGSILWQKTYNLSSTPLTTVLEAANGDFLAVAGQAFAAFVFRVTSNGAGLWMRGIDGNSPPIYGGGLVERPTGRIELFGYSWTIVTTPTGLDLFRQSYSPDGAPLGLKLYGGASADSGFSIAIAPDGGFLLGGSTGSFGTGGDLWLLKTPPDGALPPLEIPQTLTLGGLVAPVATDATAAMTTPAIVMTDTSATVTVTSATVLQQAP